MRSEEKTTAKGSLAVGWVTIIYANAKAITSSGEERFITVGSPVFANDRIVTKGEGKVSIIINDADQSHLNIGRMSEILIDEDIFGGVRSGDIAEAVADAEDVQEAFLIKGVDLTVKPEVAGAGG